MSAPVRGRRNPQTVVSALSRLAWGPPAAKVIQEALLHQDAAFDSLPAPHVETHSFDGADPAEEFNADFLLLVANALLPNARVIVVSGGLGSTDSAGVLTVIIADGGVTDAKLRDSAARSVIGRSAATAGDPADIIAGADGDVLQRAAGVLVFAAAPVTPATVVTPAQLVANANDLATATGTINRMSTDASRDVTGFVAAASGTQRRWVNVGAFDLVLKHQAAGSAAANRLLCQGGADITLTPDFNAFGWYDATTQRWRVHAE